jgi:hypothetical protein
MDVRIEIPAEPVDLAPGAQARIPVELTNESTSVASVRLAVAGGRAGAWGSLQPSTVSLAGGAARTVDLVFRRPAGAGSAGAGSAGTMLPFTVQAVDADGTPVGRATGLLALTAPERLRATLHRTATGRPVRLTLGLANRGHDRLAVAITTSLRPQGGTVQIEPATVDIAAGGTASVLVEVRPPALAVGSSIPYALTLSCRDATAGPDAVPLATVSDSGQSPPRLTKLAVAGLLGTLLLAAAGVVQFGGIVDLTGGRGSEPASGTQEAVQVRTPYVLVAVFPRNGGAGRTAADQELARLTAAGMPLRLVDSTQSAEVADGRDGLYVVLQDGFASVAEAEAYCDRFRVAAPACDVVP